MGLVHISRHGVLALVFNLIKPHIDNDFVESLCPGTMSYINKINTVL